MPSIRIHEIWRAGSASLALLCLVFLPPVQAAQPGPGENRVTGLELFEATFGPATSPCDLGFMAADDSLVVTRVSAQGRRHGIREADRVLAVAGSPVHGVAELKAALGKYAGTDVTRLTVERQGAAFDLQASCRDAADIIRARDEALYAAMRNDWSQCIRATFDEEAAWGQANSLSTGLRLWCHQARYGISAGATDLRPIDAQFLYDYIEALLVELSYLPGENADIRRRLEYQAARIAEQGHPDLASALEALIVSNAAP